MFRCCRVRSLGPVYHLGRAFPLPYLRGKAYGLAGSVQPGPQLSPPSQLSTPESQAEPSGGSLETLERVTVRGRGIHGQEPTYCVLSLTQSITQSVLHTPFPPHPHLLVHFFILQLTGPVLHTFSTCPCCQTFLCYLLLLLNKCLTAPPQQFACSIQQDQLYDNDHSLYCTTIYFEQTEQSPQEVQQIFTVKTLLCTAAVNTLKLSKYIFQFILLHGKEDMSHSNQESCFNTLALSVYRCPQKDYTSKAQLMLYSSVYIPYIQYDELFLTGLHKNTVLHPGVASPTVVCLMHSLIILHWVILSLVTTERHDLFFCNQV